VGEEAGFGRNNCVSPKPAKLQRRFNKPFGRENVQPIALMNTFNSNQERRPVAEGAYRSWLAIFPGLAVGLGLLWANISFAAPFVPVSDDFVIFTLPKREQSSVRELRVAMEKNPNDEAAVRSLVREYLELNRYSGDGRYLGYAEAALARMRVEPAGETLLVRAALSQRDHRFAEALKDLGGVLKENPANSEALLMQSSISQVVGDYPAARASAFRLTRTAPGLAALANVAQIGFLTGSASNSYALLDHAVEGAAETNLEVRVWARTMLGEMAAGLGRNGLAERHFKWALALLPREPYLLGAYADFLLDQKRYTEADALLASAESLPLLVRLAEARSRIRPKLARELVARLQGDFQTERWRGDSLHWREAARFALRIEDDPEKAFDYACKNWKAQKELIDARLVLEAALRTGRVNQAREVVDWVKAHGWTHPALNRSVLEIEKSRVNS
jgi:Tfp pilus assembly protein PilF